MPSVANWFALALCLPALALYASAADEKKEKKEAKKPEPPRVIGASPFVVAPGTTHKVKLRGQHLTNVTEVRFTNDAVRVRAAIRGASRLDPPKDADAKKAADSQLELEIRFLADTPPSTNYFVAVSPAGRSDAMPLVVFPPGALAEENEPNGGFKQAQPIDPGRTLLGALKEAADVDVFRFEGRSGQRVRIEVGAAQFGSPLDSLVTLYDASGHILGVNDDAGGARDSLLVARLPTDGAFLVSVIDAHDRGGPTYSYLLRVSLEP